MKTYKDIVKKQSELKNLYIENNMLKKIDVNVVGHFGNITTLEMQFTNCCLFSGYNLGSLLPFVLKVIVESLELSEDNGIRLSDIKEIPIRIVSSSSYGRVIGFGHFMKDRFLFVDDIIQLAKENFEDKLKKEVVINERNTIQRIS